MEEIQKALENFIEAVKDLQKKKDYDSLKSLARSILEKSKRIAKVSIYKSGWERIMYILTVVDGKVEITINTLGVISAKYREWLVGGVSEITPELKEFMGILREEIERG